MKGERGCTVIIIVLKSNTFSVSTQMPLSADCHSTYKFVIVTKGDKLKKKRKEKFPQEQYIVLNHDLHILENVAR